MTKGNGHHPDNPNGVRVYRRALTEEEIEVALRSQAGIQAAAARALSNAIGATVTRSTLSERIKASPRLQQVVRETKEEVLDLAENVVMQALNNGDFNAARFVLETQGRNRGWTRKTLLIHTVDPSKLSEEELDLALAELETMAGSMKLIDVTPDK